MSLTQCQSDTNVIENLPDSPTLDTQELKRKFDAGSSGIKDFINTVLLEEIETLVATEKRNLQTIIANEKKNLLANITEQILEDNKKKYYVGKIIIDTKNVNPATYLGFGTWQLWGAGRVPVGVNSADSDFGSVEKTGGNKISSQLNCGSSSYSFQGADGGYKDRTIIRKTALSTTHSEINAQISLLQPYITCYMWKRVS